MSEEHLKIAMLVTHSPAALDVEGPKPPALAAKATPPPPAPKPAAAKLAAAALAGSLETIALRKPTMTPVQTHAPANLVDEELDRALEGHGLTRADFDAARVAGAV